jgi:hypothetical protein
VPAQFTSGPPDGLLDPRGAEPPLAPGALGELGHLHRVRLCERHYHELGDPVPPPDLDRLPGIEVHQRYRDLPPVARIDEARGVREGEPLPAGKAGARQDQAGVAGRDRHGQTGSHHGPLPRSDLDVLVGGEV